MEKCWDCRRRKVKCDALKPTCQRCQTDGLSCGGYAAQRPLKFVAFNHDRRSRSQKRDRGVRSEGTTYTALSQYQRPRGIDRGRQQKPSFSTLQVLQRMKSIGDYANNLMNQPQPNSVQHEVSIEERVGSGIGRMVLQDSSTRRHVTTGFWTQISDELTQLQDDIRQMESDTGDLESTRDLPSPITAPDAQAPAEENAIPISYHDFLSHLAPEFPAQNEDFLPRPEDIPKLFNTYSQRVHVIIPLPHMPTTFSSIADCRNPYHLKEDTLFNRPLAFAVFYAAVASMENDEVLELLNRTKASQLQKFREGFEMALSRAEFLENPCLAILQALVIFLCLVRRNSNAKYVWMMMGLVFRMAEYLGLKHDGMKYGVFSILEIEIRRRLWWAVCALDMRASEDQGTEPVVKMGSFTTELPANLNDSDLTAEMLNVPTDRQTVTENTIHRMCAIISMSVQEIVSYKGLATVKQQQTSIRRVTQAYEQEFFRFSDPSDPLYLLCSSYMRLVEGRLILLMRLPALLRGDVKYSSSGLALETKLLLAALEVAENHHGMNVDPGCRLWRWLYQSFPQWHAIIFLLLEVSRRPWSATSERAWTVLQSPFLLPPNAPSSSDFGIWVPLRQLLIRARQHRRAEIARLRNDQQAASKLRLQDLEDMPVPMSSVLFPGLFDADKHRKRWDRLVFEPETNQTVSSTHLKYHSDPMDAVRHVEQTAETALSSKDDWATFLSSKDDWQGPSWVYATTRYHASTQTNVASYDLTTPQDVFSKQTVASLEDPMNYDWNAWFESTQGVEWDSQNMSGS